jgi:hypothetical protein
MIVAAGLYSSFELFLVRTFVLPLIVFRNKLRLPEQQKTLIYFTLFTHLPWF